MRDAYNHIAAIAGLARTLGHVHRLALLEHIAQGERSVDQLAGIADLSVANASQHLQQLKRAGLVQARREGKNVFYRLGGGPVVALLVALRRYADHHTSEIGAIVSDNRHLTDHVEGISRQELLGRIGRGDVVLLDVRSADEFAQGHLPGAINIPIAELERRLSELPNDMEVVAYCRGPYCTLSVEAVIALNTKGWRARRLNDGFMDWAAAGLSVQTEQPALPQG